MDDWLHFETDAPDLFLKAGVPTDQPIQLPGTDLYTFLIHQLLWETSYGDSSAKQENTDCLFQLLLNHLHSLTVSAANAARPSSPYHEALQLLRLDLQNAMFHQPSIEKCAKKMGISPSYFQHLYHDFFGISFQKDLIRMRLDLAKHTLINTDLTLHQIAELCGYSTDVHFYRQFRQITGITPAQYRKAQE
jgi:AraC family transcriptional regulator of arabinose operon